MEKSPQAPDLKNCEIQGAISDGDRLNQHFVTVN